VLHERTQPRRHDAITERIALHSDLVHSRGLIGSWLAALKPTTRRWQPRQPQMKIRPMPVLPRSHPDRAAATLANVVRQADAPAEPWAPPGPGAADCRIDLKLLQWRAQRAMAACAASREHLQPYAANTHQDLWSGTVQDGTARGFAARLEEAIALAGPEPVPTWLAPAADARVTTGKELRRRKDLLVASGGARVRFTRKEGVLFVDRDAELHSSNCLRFEARADHRAARG